MFDEASNVKLAGRLMKANYPKLTVMRVVVHTMSLFFNYVLNNSVLNKMFFAHNMIYIFLVLIYHKPHLIFKSKSQDFHNRNIDIFSRNET